MSDEIEARKKKLLAGVRLNFMQQVEEAFAALIGSLKAVPFDAKHGENGLMFLMTAKRWLQDGVRVEIKASGEVPVNPPVEQPLEAPELPVEQCANEPDPA